jgi:hypothetical protein
MKFHGPNHGFSTLSRQHSFSSVTPRCIDPISFSELSKIRSVVRRGRGVVYQPLRDLHFYEGMQLTAPATTTLRADPLSMLI